ncbi:3-dehydroquinate synthase [Streptomyces tanashiensis]
MHDYVSGLAEVIKAGFIADPVILDLIEEDPQAARTPAGPHTAELLVRSIRVKAEVVSGDLKEAGHREILWAPGHTLAHAIEKNERYESGARRRRLRRHGLRRRARPPRRPARRRHRRPDRAIAGVRRSAAHLRRPVAEAPGDDADRQEVRDHLLRFIVLDAIGKPTVLEGPDPAVLIAAYGEVSA